MGKEQKMTWAFFLKFIDQSYLLVDPGLLNSSGVTPNGLNLDQLNSNLTIIKLGGVPIINVTPPVNPPGYLPLSMWLRLLQTLKQIINRLL
jgi:hypothetical protein